MSVSRKDPFRPLFHFTAPNNWMSDPNGLIQFNGVYHMFYQHNPYSPEVGGMHWGHASSRDLISWKHLPIALFPDEWYEKSNSGKCWGCWSGSAVNDRGTLTLIYTSHIMEGDRQREMQCIATSKDGIVFKKYRGNPIIDTPPSEGSDDFRDPKVWKHKNSWYMVLGSGKDGHGKCLLYQSEDLYNWRFKSVVAEGDGSSGYMWECPNLFPLRDKYVLMVSPKMEQAKTIYFIGTFDYDSGVFREESRGVVDFGPDFYAPQMFFDDQGRCIIIGWMGHWGVKKMPTKEYGWAGMMALPRTLSLFSDNTLCVKPIDEILNLRGELLVDIADISINSNSVWLHKVEGNALEILIAFDFMNLDVKGFELKIKPTLNGSEETIIKYCLESRKLIIDSNYSGIGEGGVYSHHLSPNAKNKIILDIFIDRSSLEVFANEGRLAGSVRIFPEPSDHRNIILFPFGHLDIASLKIWKMVAPH